MRKPNKSVLSVYWLLWDTSRTGSGILVSNIYPPRRGEKTLFLKVNDCANVWYDHGVGKEGNVVDFGLLYPDGVLEDVRWIGRRLPIYGKRRMYGRVKTIKYISVI